MQGGLGLNGIPKGAEGEENLTLYLKLLGTTIGADAWRTLGSIFLKQQSLSAQHVSVSACGGS